jgi:putative nucleotidyltransferase with HDIG domain
LLQPTSLETTNTQTDASHAAKLAERLLGHVGTRLAHSARVAYQAGRATRLLEHQWRSVIVRAAWLHDIGYSDQVAQTGFHPLDGARWLRDRGWPSEVCRLVAWHSEAGIEAALRSLDGDLAAEFDQPPSLVAAALAWADLTSSPTGTACAVSQRIDDILDRHPSDSAAHTATVAARPALRGATGEVEALLASGGATA